MAEQTTEKMVRNFLSLKEQVKVADYIRSQYERMHQKMNIAEIKAECEKKLEVSMTDANLRTILESIEVRPAVRAGGGNVYTTRYQQQLSELKARQDAAMQRIAELESQLASQTIALSSLTKRIDGFFAPRAGVPAGR